MEAQKKRAAAATTWNTAYVNVAKAAYVLLKVYILFNN